PSNICCIFLPAPIQHCSCDNSFTECQRSKPTHQLIRLYYHLHCLCQALDLRVFELIFNKMMGDLISEAVANSFVLQLSMS
ncbi:phenylalanine ammonia-lyase, partial [Puccinia sorghi]